MIKGAKRSRFENEGGEGERPEAYTKTSLEEILLSEFRVSGEGDFILEGRSHGDPFEILNFVADGYGFGLGATRTRVILNFVADRYGFGLGPFLLPLTVLNQAQIPI
ncbi:hypothetical protein Salat_1387800 [Sesamum alatum]|uniref:Uncharacterized protein n=1 Tax=Sesamum alatum TaxID=300844 RepID=A0AAE1YAP3_9LAMI|nr:hypothetical protein Salat_1387800 [Sesamum alatum]